MSSVTDAENPDTDSSEAIQMEKPTEFSAFIKGIREKIPVLKTELAQVYEKLSAFSMEWQNIDGVEETSDIQSKKLEIQKEHAAYSLRLNEISTELSTLREPEQLIQQIDQINQELDSLNQEDDKADNPLNQEIKERLRILNRHKESINENLLKIYENWCEVNAVKPPTEQETADVQEPEFDELLEQELTLHGEEASELEATTDTEVDVTKLESIKAFSRKTELENRDSYEKSLDLALEALKNTSGIVELKHGLPTIVLPDLHGRREMLASALEQKDNDGNTLLDLLKEGKINFVCLGDGMHTEQAANWEVSDSKYMLDENGRVQYDQDGKPLLTEFGKIYDRFKTMQAEYLQQRGLNPHTTDLEEGLKDPGVKALYNKRNEMAKEIRNELMHREMISSLGLMKLVMELKAHYLDSFHFIRGNHDDVMAKFMKFDNESENVRSWMAANLGEEFLDKWAELEESLPIAAIGEELVLSHAAPAKVLTKAEISDRSVLTELTWTDNRGWLENDERVEQTLKNLGMPTAVWLVGHRPVRVDENGGRYRQQFGGKLVQINNPDRPVIAIIPANRKLNPEQDIRFI